MNLNTSWTELNNALKTLNAHWEEIKPVWNDVVRESFEKDLWEPLEAQVRTTLRGMERLMPVLLQMHQECE